MIFRHVLVSLAALCLVACSADDTIVSLNVTATDRVPAVDRIQATFKQGSRSFVHDFAPPSEDASTPDGEPSIKNSFFTRITLPDGWDDSKAQISVEAFRENQERFDPPLTDETTVKIEPEGVVAAYVRLDIPEPPPVAEAGAGGTPSENGGAPDAPGGAGGSNAASSGGAGGAE